jgi:Ribbon-helix-helix protein, copG family
MAKQSKTVHKKSRGRPAGIKYGETIPARFEPATMAALDAWADAYEVSRSEAIRRLVELGLKAKSAR